MINVISKVARLLFATARKGALLSSVSLLLIVSGCSHKPTRQEQFQSSLNLSQQQWFDQFHPVGHAKSVNVHDVEEIKGHDGDQTIVRFTLYWEGPFTKNGFTKIRAVHDAESQRWVRAEILESNGITTTQTIDGIGAFVAGFIEGAANY